MLKAKLLAMAIDEEPVPDTRFLAPSLTRYFFKYRYSFSIPGLGFITVMGQIRAPRTS